MADRPLATHRGDMAPRKLLVLTTSLTPGGAEKLALKLAGAWAEAGAEVTVATLIEAAHSMPLPAGVRHLPLRHPGDRPGLVGRAAGTAACLARLRRMVTRWQPDAVVAHVDRTNLMALLATRGLAVPVVVVEHNHPVLHPIGTAWSRLRDMLYPKASRIVGVSQGVVDALPPACLGRAVAIHNWVEPPPGALPSAGIGSEHIVAMGRLVPQKGFDILVRAFATVAARSPRARLSIWGRGDQASLRELAGQLGIDERVSLNAFTDRPAEALLSGAVMAFPSRYEGFGLVLAEAMALGVPVVAADCPSGPAEIVRHGVDGLLVPPEDPEALAAALLQVLEDDALAMRLALRAPEVLERFSFERARQAWAALLDEVSARG